MRSGIIYKATSPIGKAYIGQTIHGLDKRKAIHLNASKSARYENNHFYNAINLHGWENFTWDILASEIPEDQLDALEIQYIASHKTFTDGYNSTPGGSTFRGRIISDATRARMSISATKRSKHSMTGRAQSLATRSKMSVAGTGKVKSEAHKKRIAESVAASWQARKLSKPEC